MMKKSSFGRIIFASLLAVMMFAPAAMAGQLTIDRVGGYYSGLGGEFNLSGADLNSYLARYSSLAKYNNNAGALGFGSFCLERTEYVNIPGTYNYTLNQKAIQGSVGPAGDPLSQGTAFLYEQFAKGTLAGYNYTPGAGREGSAAALQNAIWFLEGEAGGSLDAAYQAMLIAEFGSVANAKLDNNGLYRVAVLNLYTRDGAHAQDQLVMVPEPATLLLLGAGLVGLAALRRRSKKV